MNRSAMMRALGAMLALAVASARAEPIADLRTTFPVDSPACFSNVFDAAHLQAHPEQTVTAIRLVRAYPQLRMEDEAAGPANDASKNAEQAGGVMAQLIVALRDSGGKGSPKRFAAAVNCTAEAGASKMRCGIDCDGGGFFVEREAAGTLRMTIEDGRNLRIAGGCTNRRAYRGLGAEPGDRSFSLTPTPMTACR
jgi:hypothetical protein